MQSAAFLERAALDALEERWRGRGYTVVREPSADQLPGFLKGFRPDALATGATPPLVIEVVNPRAAAAQHKVTRLQSLFAGQNEWKLEIVYAPGEDMPLDPVSEDAIAASLQSARRLAGGEPQAALLMAWAGLEAVVRARFPDIAEGAGSMGLLLGGLLEQGHISQEQTTLLLALGRRRNALVHGQLDITPGCDDIAAVIDLADRLQREGAPA